MEPVHQVYLIPGMFGFARLAGYDYFGHISSALLMRMERAGLQGRVEVIPTPPTASLRRRARVAAQAIHSSASKHDGPIYLVGHSTGGLDARLITSPTIRLGIHEEGLAWRSRVEATVTINSPHYGTPLASFFTTVSGARLLYTLSLLTVATLSIGGPPLTVFSTLLAGVNRLDDRLTRDPRMTERTTELLLRLIGEQGRQEVQDWLNGIREDQGGIIQITPEAMELFNATTENDPTIRYGCMASSSPPPAPKRWVRSLRSPYSMLSAAIYSTLHTVTSRAHPHYPCPEPPPSVRRRLEQAVGHSLSDSSADGVIPILSMLWGELIWAGPGDHLDVVGHFHDRISPSKHTDWLESGSSTDHTQFEKSMDALFEFLTKAQVTG